MPLKLYGIKTICRIYGGGLIWYNGIYVIKTIVDGLFQ